MQGEQPRGIQFQRVVLGNNYQVLCPNEATYWPTSRKKLPNLLDFFVTSNIIQRNTTQTLHDIIRPLSCLSNPTQFPLRQPSLCTLITCRIDWQKFTRILDGTINLKEQLKTPQQLDHAVNSPKLFKTLPGLPQSLPYKQILQLNTYQS